MARGTTLGELVVQLRNACKLDTNAALSVSLMPSFKQMLRQEQERLYDEYDWPHMFVYADKQLAAGSRYYDVPTNMNLERIQKVDVKYGGVWLPVERGIDLTDYDVHDSDFDARAEPTMKWELRDTGSGPQIEVWPIPINNYDSTTGDGTLRIRGIRKLAALVAETDTADLDDYMIVDYCAAEYYVGVGDGESAKIKLQRATARRDTLQSRMSRTRHKSFSLGAGVSVDPRGKRQSVIVVKEG